MEIDMEQVRETTLNVISKVVKEGKLEENTQKAIRRKVENAMNLETGALDGQEYKDAVKDVVQDYIANHDDESAERDEGHAQKKGKGKKASSTTAESKAAKLRKPRSSASKVAKGNDTASKKSQKGKKPARSASIVPASDEDEEAEVKPAASKPKPAKKSAKSKRVDSDEEVSGADSTSGPPAKRQKTATPAKNEMSAEATPSSSSPAPPPRSGSQPDSLGKQGDGEKSESEMSVLEDDDPPAPRMRNSKKAEKSGGSSRAEKSTKSRKRKEPAKELSKDEETIKRLKSFVVACGVRKVWSKEFKDLDKPSDQIRRLRQILADLGMTGRMSMDQAKVIREKREFAQELEDVQEFAQKMEAAGRRRAQKSDAAEEAGLNDSDVEAPPKRRITARQSIMAFLGDEEESE